MTKRTQQDETREARKSAFVVAAVCFGIAGWNLYKQRTHIAYPAGAIGCVLALLGLAVPAGARAFHRVWMKLAHALGWVNSRILLGGMFYLVMAPIGWIVRMTGGDPLNRRRAAQPTYWIPRKVTRPSPEQFERLF
ncbi:MAG: SxtJ family membrane protein [Bryobacterales bacterium]